MSHDQITDFEYIRDYAFRAVYGNWAFLKNHAPEEDRVLCANRSLGWLAYIGGKRESRRLMGDVILQQQDIIQRREFPDACVTATWSIDLHYPAPENTEHFPGEEFRSIAEHLRFEPYPIPYRCLYSRNVPNLMMAGRNISVTHVALGTVRVQRTTGMMGEVVGMAASLCKKRDTTPRGVYKHHLEELKALMTEGVGVPPPPPPQPDLPVWVRPSAPNVARSARVTVSGNLDASKYPPAHVNDGRYDVADNSLRWVSDKSRPDYVELAWDTPQRVNALRILTGQKGVKEPQSPIIDFVLQYHDGSQWKDIPGTEVIGNEWCDWNYRFPTITADRVRLVVHSSPGNLTRIWELELYHLP